MRKWITLIENETRAGLQAYLRGDFYHGTARTNLKFHDTAPAYLTKNKALALEYAEDDAEVAGGTPYVLRVRLHCTTPYVTDHGMMQDLHMSMEHGAFVRDLLTQGYDCVVGDTGVDEICVIDPSKIEVVEEIKMRDPGGESTRGQFGSYHNQGIAFQDYSL